MPLSPERMAELDQYYANQPDYPTQLPPEQPKAAGLTPERIAQLDQYYANKKQINTPQNDGFFGEMGANFNHGIQSAKDLYNGNYEDIGRTLQTPKTQALADKMFPQGYQGGVLEAIGNVGNTSASDWSGALLEKFGNTPEGKALSVIGGINPAYNAASTAVNRYVNPAIEKTTGVNPDNLQLMEMLAGTAGLKKAGQVSDPSLAVARKAGGYAKEGIATRIKGAFGAMTPEEIQTASDKLGTDTTAAYKALDDANAVVGPQSAGGLASGIKQALIETDLDPEFTPKTLAALRLLDKHLEETGGEIKVGRIDQYRRLLSRARSPEDVMASVKARSVIDSYLNNLSPTDFSKGGPQSIDLLNTARATAAKEFKYNDLAELVTKAGGEPNKLKAAFTKFVGDNDNLRGLSDQEIKSLKAAANRTPAEFLERALGTFGFDAGKLKNIALPTLVKGGALAVPGGPALVGAGTALRQTGKYAARGAAQNALDQIYNAPLKTKPRVVSGDIMPSDSGPKMPLMLSAPREMPEVMVPAGNGAVRPMTETEYMNADFNRQIANSLGMSGDKYAGMSQNFDALDKLSQSIKNMQMNQMHGQNEPSIGDLISNSGSKYTDSGLPIGNLGEALLQLLQNQKMQKK